MEIAGTAHLRSRIEPVGIAGVCKKLQRRQSLLTIDNIPSHESADLCLVGLKHNGAEKVSGVEVWLGDSKLGNPPDVLPQRLPLLILSPDIRTLEQGNHEVLRQIEQLQRCSLEGLHAEILPFIASDNRYWLAIRFSTQTYRVSQQTARALRLVHGFAIWGPSPDLARRVFGERNMRG